jgi:hypothetical protein
LNKEWSTACDRHLHMWAVVQTCLQFAMVLNKIFLLRYSCTRYGVLETLTPWTRRFLRCAALANHAGNILWLSWSVVGLVLRFGKSDCAATKLLTLILVQLTVQWTLLGLAVLALCFVFCTTLFISCLCPGIIRHSDNIITGVTVGEIEQLRQETYDPANTEIFVEDAFCAICISSYELNEKVRYLPCKHHFHGDCIKTWLVRSKSCPFCKRQVDDQAGAPPDGNPSSANLPEVMPSESQVESVV